MLNKTLISSAILSVILLSSGMAVAAGENTSKMDSASSMSIGSMSTFGEIVGDFNSPDGAVVGATLPGNKVTFKIPAKGKAKEYLHFAFMHAESASDGWYFAPNSDKGIELSGLISGDKKSVDITKQIGLFQAPTAKLVEKVKADKGKLKYGAADKFMTATLTLENDMFVIDIKNISEGGYSTPFSSGVWAVTDKKEKGFDHIPSVGLSTLATSGHRDMLYQMVKKHHSK